MIVCQTVESGLVTFLKTKTFTDIPATQIYRGFDQETAIGTSEEAVQKRPCIVCECGSARRADVTSGNWYITARISVRSNADDSTDAAHLARATEVFDQLATSTIAADLSSAIANFHCFYALPDESADDIIKRSFESVFTLDMMVALKSLT